MDTFGSIAGFSHALWISPEEYKTRHTCRISRNAWSNYRGTPCFILFAHLHRHSLDVTIVFDGAPLPSKRETEILRQKAREESLVRARELEAAGDVRGSYPFYAKSVDVTPEMAFRVAQAVRPMGVRVLVAPYEADAQLAYLSINNLVDFVISEDSDLLVYGCARVLYKYDYKTERGREIVRKNIFESHPEFSRMTSTSFLITCILSGCDYLPSLNQIGIRTATSIGSRLEKFLAEQTSDSLQTIVNRVIVLLKLSTSSKFEDKKNDVADQIIAAIRTFRHQVVFCTRDQKLVHLEPPSESFDKFFLGEIYGHEIALRVANCEVHPETKSEFQMSDAIPEQPLQPRVKQKKKQMTTVETNQRPTHLTLMDCWNRSSRIVLGENVDNPCGQPIVIDSPISIMSSAVSSPPRKKINITDLDQFAYNY